MATVFRVFGTMADAQCQDDLASWMRTDLFDMWCHSIVVVCDIADSGLSRGTNGGAVVHIQII